MKILIKYKKKYKLKRKININDCEATVADEVLEQTHAYGGERFSDGSMTSVQK